MAGESSPDYHLPFGRGEKSSFELISSTSNPMYHLDLLLDLGIFICFWIGVEDLPWILRVWGERVSDSGTGR